MGKIKDFIENIKKGFKDIDMATAEPYVVTADALSVDKKALLHEAEEMSSKGISNLMNRLASKNRGNLDEMKQKVTGKGRSRTVQLERTLEEEQKDDEIAGR